MGKIRVLPDDLCHHIAAGEVVEKPAAVVKELVENSLDAGSSHITVCFEKGGIKLVRVIDNGEGMDREDALLALERHATSKIRTLEDLHNIKSLGFRGEALTSISAVSRFELITRTQEEELGTKVYVEGGVLKSVEPTGCPAGSTVTVKDLFFNVPARRKFLKSENTERQYILDQLKRLIISHHHVHFELYEGQKCLWNYPGTKDSRERIVQLFHIKPFQRLITLNLNQKGVSIRGHLGDPSMGRPSVVSIFLFVNGRYFKDALIHKTIREACKPVLPKGIFPFLVLFLEMDPGDVDVNVHPTKQEVRFRNPTLITTLIKEAILEGINQLETKVYFASLSGEVCETSLKTSEPPEIFKEEPLPIKGEFCENASFKRLSEKVIFEHSKPRPTPQSPLSVLGVLNNIYIICSSPEGLIVIDFHAAHERILYNRLTSIPLPLPSQKLALPILLPVSSEDMGDIEKNRSGLLLLGYDIEPFGKDTIAVRAIPSIGIDISHEEVLAEIIRTGFGDEPDGSILERFASTVACHGALRAGKILNHETISWLLNQLLTDPHIFCCPHGRPVWINISFREISKRFGRSS